MAEFIIAHCENRLVVWSNFCSSHVVLAAIISMLDAFGYKCSLCLSLFCSRYLGHFDAGIWKQFKMTQRFITSKILENEFQPACCTSPSWKLTNGRPADLYSIPYAWTPSAGTALLYDSRDSDLLAMVCFRLPSCTNSSRYSLKFLFVTQNPAHDDWNWFGNNKTVTISLNGSWIITYLISSDALFDCFTKKSSKTRFEL